MTATNNGAAPAAWTVKALLSWTIDYLHKKGLEPREARLESHVLLAHVMNCQRIELVARSDEEPTGDERTSFKDLIRRRVERWPVAYLVGRREFYLLSFEVTPAVLIPRPDTPALWISTSIPSGATAAARVATCSAQRTSSWCSTRSPAIWPSAPGCASVRVVACTRQASAAYWRASSSPIPRLAPIIIAVGMQVSLYSGSMRS